MVNYFFQQNMKSFLILIIVSCDLFFVPKNATDKNKFALYQQLRHFL